MIRVKEYDILYVYSDDFSPNFRRHQSIRITLNRCKVDVRRQYKEH